MTPDPNIERLEIALTWVPSRYRDAAQRDLASVAADLEAAKAREINYPYAQAVGRNAVVVLTAEMIDLILHFFRDVSTAETLACEVTAEMRRARAALAAGTAAEDGETT